MLVDRVLTLSSYPSSLLEQIIKSSQPTFRGGVIQTDGRLYGSIMHQYSYTLTKSMKAGEWSDFLHQKPNLPLLLGWVDVFDIMMFMYQQRYTYTANKRVYSHCRQDHIFDPIDPHIWSLANKAFRPIIRYIEQCVQRSRLRDSFLYESRQDTY